MSAEPSFRRGDVVRGAAEWIGIKSRRASDVNRTPARSP